MREQHPFRFAEKPTPVTRAPRRGGDRDGWRVWIGIAVVGVAVLALLAYLAYGTISARMAAAKKYDDARVLIEDADSTVVQVDVVIRSRITTPGLSEEASAAARRIADARHELERATRLLEAGQEDRTDDEQEQAGLLKATAAARLAMLAEAEKLLPLNIQAAGALAPANAGWTALLEAKRLSDSAVASYNKLTKAGVTRSNRLNKQAAVKLAAAKSSFEEAEKAFPEADFAPYLTYVEMRLRLNKLSQQSDLAWLKGDPAAANAVIKTYNTEDKKAVEQAKRLPASPEAVIAAAYEAAAGAATDAYNAARAAALKADEALRDF